MRKACLDMVYQLAKRDPRVMFIGSDLSPGLLKEMQAAFPMRYFMEGVAEQHVVGMAAGMALEGYIPYVNTIATFITRRCYEQVAIDACLHRLPIRLIGNGGGLVYAPLGPTHLAIDDIALMRALPGMTVVAVCDAEEMVRLMEASLDWPDPLYVRLAKGGDKIVSHAEHGFTIGKAILLRDTNVSRPILFVTTGVMTQQALLAAEMLEQQGLAARVLHMHSIKPLDHERLLDYAAESALIVTVEEHSIIGGLGSAVAECLLDHGQGKVPLTRLGITDAFPTRYGRQEDLLEFYGLDAASIAASVQKAYS